MPKRSELLMVIAQTYYDEYQYVEIKIIDFAD